MRLLAFNFKFRAVEAAVTAPVITVPILSTADSPVFGVPCSSSEDVALLNYNVKNDGYVRYGLRRKAMPDRKKATRTRKDAG